MKNKRFNIYANLNIYTSINISAATLEDALIKAKALDVTDFVKIDGEHIDSSLEISGVIN